jgi:hypothetical protein
MHFFHHDCDISDMGPARSQSKAVSCLGLFKQCNFFTMPTMFQMSVVDTN